MTLCGNCQKPLRNFDEVHAVDGILYCSRECAIEDLTNNIIMNAKSAAIEIYDCDAEVVATADIMKDEMCELVEDKNSAHSKED